MFYQILQVYKNTFCNSQDDKEGIREMLVFIIIWRGKQDIKIWIDLL